MLRRGECPDTKRRIETRCGGAESAQPRLARINENRGRTDRRVNDAGGVRRGEYVGHRGRDDAHGAMWRRTGQPHPVGERRRDVGGEIGPPLGGVTEAGDVRTRRDPSDVRERLGPREELAATAGRGDVGADEQDGAVAPVGERQAGGHQRVLIEHGSNAKARHR